MAAEKKKFSGFITLLIALVVIIVVIISTIVWQEVQLNTLQFSIAQLQKKKARLENEKKKMLVKKAKLENPRRIKNIAINQLGLEEPEERKVIIIKVN